MACGVLLARERTSSDSYGPSIPGMSSFSSQFGLLSSRSSIVVPQSTPWLCNVLRGGSFFPS